MKNKTKRIDLLASNLDEQNLRKASEKMGTTKVSETIFKSVKEVANKPIEYYCDRVAIRQNQENISYCLIHLNSFIQEFKAVTGEIPTIEELQSCLADVGKLGSTQKLKTAIQELVTQKLYDRMVANHPDMTVTIENNPAKDLTALFSASNKLDNAPELKMFFIGIQWTCYDIDISEGKISINQDQLEKLNESYRWYASTSEDLRKLSLVKSACEALDNILKDKGIIPSEIFRLFNYDQEAARFVPSGAWIRYSAAPPVYFSK